MPACGLSLRTRYLGTDVSGRQPAVPQYPAQQNWLAALLNPAQVVFYLKVHLLVQLHRCVAGEVEAILWSVPSSTQTCCVTSGKFM